MHIPNLCSEGFEPSGHLGLSIVPPPGHFGYRRLFVLVDYSLGTAAKACIGLGFPCISLQAAPELTQALSQWVSSAGCHNCLL